MSPSMTKDGDAVTSTTKTTATVVRPSIYPSASSSSPEFVAVILCGTSGARMYPLSTEPSPDDDEENGYRPKHLLPIAGVPILVRSLLHVQRSGFRRCVVAVSAFDKGSTLSVLKEDPLLQLSNVVTIGTITKATLPNNTSLFVFDLPSDCEGSVDALLDVVAAGGTDDGTSLIYQHSHVVVMPSDLVLETDDDHLGALADTHRRGVSRRTVALTALLADVGDEDEQG